MYITLQIDENLITTDEKEKLKVLLNSRNEVQFSKALKKITESAFVEYKEMLLGNGLPTRADEIKQHRLLHLIKHYFINRIPTESEVSSMFQLTELESRSLIRNVRTRFRFQLEKELNKTLKSVIKSAEYNEEERYYEVILKSDNVLEELNNIISREGPNLYPIKRISNCVRKYKISEDSYDLLCKYLELNVDNTACEIVQ